MIVLCTLEMQKAYHVLQHDTFLVAVYLVIHKRNFLDSKSFFLIEFLFFFENSLIEKLLKFFVAIVDAKLFETVDGEILEAGNVENADVIRRSLKWNTLWNKKFNKITKF